MEGTVPTPIFEEACKTAARTFGKKHNVSVVFAGKFAKTDGSTIYLPALDQNKKLTKDQLAVGRGYVDHEAGHIRHTNNDIYTKAIKEAVRCDDKLLPQVMNALEDVRIERLITKQYPGAKTNLQATTRSVNNIYLDRHKQKPEIADTLSSVGAVAMTWEGRRRLGYDKSKNEECIDTLSDDLRKEVEQFVDMVDGMRNTEDMITCARSIAKTIRVRDDVPEPTEANASGSGDGDGDGKGGAEGSGKGSAFEATDEDQKLDGELNIEDEEFDSDDKGGGIGAGKVHKGKAQKDHKGIDPIPVETNIGRMLGQTDHDYEDDSQAPYTVATTESDKFHHASDKKNKYYSDYADRDYTYGVNMNDPKGDMRYQEVINIMGSRASVMRRKLERALMSTQLRGWNTGFEHGRFDSKRLVSAYQGVPNVYKLREEIEELDTAVSILVDMSGSMNGRRTLLAQQSCIALAESVHKVGCALEIRGFTCTSSVLKKEHSYNRYGGSKGKFSRLDPIDIFVFKKFEEKLMNAKRSLGNLASVQDEYGGNNADACSVLSSIKSLNKRKESKKILMVLSDGYPAHHSSYGYDHVNQNLRDVVQYGMDLGLDIIGIGIQSNAVKQFYPDYHVIQDLDDLVKNCMDKIAKRLLGNRYVVDNADLIKAKKITA